MEFVKDKISRFFAILRRNLLFLFPIFFVVIASVLITYLSLSKNLPRLSFVPYVLESSIEVVFINVLFFVGLTSSSMLFIHYAFKVGMMDLIEKLFGIGGGFLTILFFSLLSYTVFQPIKTLFELFITWLGPVFLIFIMILTIFGTLPQNLKDIIFLIYSSITGSFLGLGIPILSMMHILIAVCIIDLIFYRLGILRRTANLSREQSIYFKIKGSGRELLVGWGDLVYYSMFTSYSLANFGSLITLLCGILFLAGWLLTIFFAMDNAAFPGLPIPILLGMMPILFNLDPAYLPLLLVPLLVDRFIEYLRKSKDAYNCLKPEKYSKASTATKL